MATNDYYFVTNWRVKGDIDDVWEILNDPSRLPQWWPSVYLSVQVERPEDIIRLHTRGWLPYTLRWHYSIVESHHPNGFTIRADGDFVGEGIWTLAQQGEFVTVRYDWRIKADKPLIRTLSFLMKPIFRANHDWAMARGEESLQLELNRRRVTSPAERKSIPSPPGPSNSSVVLTAAAAITVGLGYLIWRYA